MQTPQWKLEQAPVVYEYLSYQAFLRDYLNHRKEKSPAFSLAAFCRRSGVLSKTYLSMVLHNKRKLPAKKTALLGDALGLGPRERRYFEGLVHFNHARSEREKEVYLKQLVEARPAKHQANLPELGYGTLYSWHCLVILELAKLSAFQPNGKWISARLKGRLSALEAKRALESLRDAGMLIADKAGRLRPAEATIRTSDEIRSLAIQKYHQSCLALGSEILRTAKLEDREFASVNLLLSPAKFLAAKEKIKAFREELLALADGEKPQAAVCQMNIQFFCLER